MTRHPRLLPMAAALLALLAAPPARAAWDDWKALPKATAPDDLLLAVDALSPVQFVVGGVSLKATNDAFPIPAMSPVLHRTQDGGQVVQDIHGNLPGLMAGAVNAVAFQDLKDGWAAIGGDVWRTTNGGTWEKASLVDGQDGTVNALARLGAGTGVAVGTGGRAWRTQDGGMTWDEVQTNTGADLACVKFLDGRKGWAAGAVAGEESVSEPGGGMEQLLTHYDEVVVLGTSDGGTTWKTLATIPKDEADGAGGKMACPLHFLSNGQDGWLALSRYDQEKARAKEAVLLRTRDGGKTWTDTNTDFTVGTLNFMIKVPIKMAYAAGMHWEDGLHGHLVGTADTGMSASGGGGGGDQPIYRSVDMVTKDGGKTWAKTDLGEITMNLGGGQVPSGDPRPTKAEFLDGCNAVLVGEKGNVWRFECLCTRDSDCPTGYHCQKPDPSVHAKCYPLDPEGPDGSGGPDAAGDRDVWGGVDLAWNDGVPPILDVPPCEGEDCPKAKKGGGCAGMPLPGGGAGAWPAALLLGFLLVAGRRARR